MDPNSPHTRGILLLDAMAQRYSKLPSEVNDQASTLDLLVFDVALSYQQYEHYKQSGKTPPAEMFGADELAERLKNVQNKRNRG